MRNDRARKKIFYQIPVLLLILAISVPMVTAPMMSNILYSLSSVSVDPIGNLVYAEGKDDSGDDSSGDDSSGDDSSGDDSSGGDQSTSTTTDPSLASTTTDPSLASTTTDPSLASTTTDPSLGQGLLALTDNNGILPPLVVADDEDQDLNCDDISDKNFKVSSNDQNGFDGDNDGIGCESSDDNIDGNAVTPLAKVENEGPDRDCLLNPDLPKCASIDGDCPDGFFQNDDDQCVPEGGCPDGYHTVDDDETGRCIPNSDGCPIGMIFRPDGTTCGNTEDVCQDNVGLEGCTETPQESCDPSYPDHCIPPSQTDLDCNWDGNVKDDQIPDKNFPVGSSDPHGFDGNDNDGIGCEDDGSDGPGSDKDVLNCKDISGSIKVSSSDPNRLDKDKDGIGCENNDNDNNGNDNDNNGNDNDNNGNDQYIIKASNSCDDISDTVDLSSEQIDSQDVRIIAYFDNCDLESASLHLNIIQNNDLKLVAAHLENGLTDAIEVDMNPIEQSPSNSNTMYEATITDNQEGHDLETGDLKTLNNVNGIVLWNDDEDEPIEFADNNFVEANINFFN